MPMRIVFSLVLLFFVSSSKNPQEEQLESCSEFLEKSSVTVDETCILDKDLTQEANWIPKAKGGNIIAKLKGKADSKHNVLFIDIDNKGYILKEEDTSDVNRTLSVLNAFSRLNSIWNAHKKEIVPKCNGRVPELSTWKQTHSEGITFLEKNDVVGSYLDITDGHATVRKVQSDPLGKNTASSLAGATVASYLLQLGDRHYDNILMSTQGDIIHIDFDRALGSYSTVETKAGPSSWIVGTIVKAWLQSSDNGPLFETCYNSLVGVLKSDINACHSIQKSFVPGLNPAMDMWTTCEKIDILSAMHGKLSAFEKVMVEEKNGQHYWKRYANEVGKPELAIGSKILSERCQGQKGIPIDGDQCLAVIQEYSLKPLSFGQSSTALV